jgi:hypothetical protein
MSAPPITIQIYVEYLATENLGRIIQFFIPMKWDAYTLGTFCPLFSFRLLEIKFLCVAPANHRALNVCTCEYTQISTDTQVPPA